MGKRAGSDYSGRSRRECFVEAEAVTSWPNVILATIGFSQKKARMAATRLQANAAQRTGRQESVASSSLAAPHPEKIDAIPLEV